MEFRPTYIELPVPSERWKTINAFFDPQTNSDNFGFVRCKTCYVRFPPTLDEKSKIDHLKTHLHKWKYFMERVGDSLGHIYNDADTIYGDEREKEDLRLSIGLTNQDENLVVRFPRSRTSRARYFSNRWKKNDTSWNKIVADEYQNNHVGAYQGNYDKPICETGLRCGNSFLTFSEFSNYRHEPKNMCRVFEVNKRKYSELENKDKIKAYFIIDQTQVQDFNIVGPATVIESNRIIYTCENHSCVFPCLCKDCVLGTGQCGEHKISHPNLFDPKEDFFIVRNADSFNINCNTGNITYSNSMQKGQEMVYDVYKYAGIKHDCSLCSTDIFHHQAFHFVYHDSCKFCRASKHRIEEIRTHDQFLIRFENRRFEEKVSCHYCYKIFSSVQFKNKHVKNTHEDNDGTMFTCDTCNKKYNSQQKLVHHIQNHHENNTQFTCTICEKTFKLKHSLNVHVKSVHNFKTVNCAICDKSFNRQSNLNGHMKYVHDIVDNFLIMDDGLEIAYHGCEECSFTSRYEIDLRRHNVTVHSDKKDFKCTKCDFSCNRMDNLGKHIRNIHEKETKPIYSCTECDFTSSYLTNLRRHMREVHK